MLLFLEGVHKRECCCAEYHHWCDVVVGTRLQASTAFTLLYFKYLNKCEIWNNLSQVNCHVPLGKAIVLLHKDYTTNASFSLNRTMGGPGVCF